MRFCALNLWYRGGTKPLNGDLSELRDPKLGNFTQPVVSIGALAVNGGGTVNHQEVLPPTARQPTSKHPSMEANMLVHLGYACPKIFRDSFFSLLKMLEPLVLEPFVT